MYTVIIIGGGIAGTTLAWTLHRRQIDFLLIDKDESQTASKVAAGLVTPITGRRVNSTLAWPTAYQTSDSLYRYAEGFLPEPVWFVAGSARICPTISAAQGLPNRLAGFESIDTTWMRASQFDPAWRAEFGGFWMPQAARLDVTKFLRLSQQYFALLGCFKIANIDLDDDLEVDSIDVNLKSLNASARFVICCRGVADSAEGPFSQARFAPAQGDILRIKTENLIQPTTIHSQWWMTPTKVSLSRDATDDWLLGSTYQWDPLDSLPSAAGRKKLLDDLAERLQQKVEVIEHRVGIRPASFDQRPLIGLHPQHRQLGMLNGLGAKGCYLGPWCAQILADAMFNGAEIPPMLQWHRGQKK